MRILNTDSEISLKNYNTFGLDVLCRGVLPFESENELLEQLEMIRSKRARFMVLGGGSNVLFINDLDKFVLLNRIQGIEIVEDLDDELIIEVGGGVNWHELVLYCVANEWSGIENLSLIPGCVGAAPIQNIGAYGVELKDVFHSLRGYHLEDQKWQEFTAEECNFGYRQSIFKDELKGKFIITKVRLQLKKNFSPNISYGAIAKVLKEKGIDTPTIKEVSDAVISIRQSKLPDPKKLGNSGSFFKNPIIKRSKFNELRNRFPDIPMYLVDDEHVKVPAGWLIEKAGFKGKRVGNTGSHKDQALVIVNYGNATGAEIYDHAQNVIHKIKEKFGIALVPEVNIIEA